MQLNCRRIRASYRAACRQTAGVAEQPSPNGVASTQNRLDDLDLLTVVDPKLIATRMPMCAGDCPASEPDLGVDGAMI